MCWGWVCVCECVARGGQSSIKVRLLKKWKCPGPQTSISVQGLCYILHFKARHYTRHYRKYNLGHVNHFWKNRICGRFSVARKSKLNRKMIISLFLSTHKQCILKNTVTLKNAHAPPTLNNAENYRVMAKTASTPVHQHNWFNNMQVESSCNHK